MMDEREIKLWRVVDIGGFSSYLTLFSFTLDTIESNVNNDEQADLPKKVERLLKAYANLAERYDKIDIRLLNNNFPIEVIRKIKEVTLPELGKKYNELETLLKHYLSGASYLKVRIVNKIKECKAVVKELSDLGVEFTRCERYWEYRNTNPERIYLKRDFE